MALADRFNPSKYLAAFEAPRITLLVVTLVLLLLGLVIMFSASFTQQLDQGDPAYGAFFKMARCAVYGVVAAVGCFVAATQQDFRQIGPYVLIVIAWGLILATEAAGTTELGAKRTLGVFQTGEFCKIFIVIMGARLMADYRAGTAQGWPFLGKVVFLVLLPLVLLFKFQSDLGAALIIGVGLLAVLWLGEMPRPRFFALLFVAAVVVIFKACFGGDYRSERWAYLDPWNDGMQGLGSGSQNIHAYYALATGGLLGVGLGGSHEKYGWLAEAENDVVFAVLGEELGFVGCVLVIVLFLLLLAAGILIAKNCTDVFGRVVAGGLISMLVFQALMNIGCACGMLPITGKPLPFFSQGGISLIATLMIIGTVLGVTRESSQVKKLRDDLRVVRSENASDSYSRGRSAVRASRFAEGDRGGALGAGRTPSLRAGSRQAGARGGGAHGRARRSSERR